MILPLWAVGVAALGFVGLIAWYYRQGSAKKPQTRVQNASKKAVAAIGMALVSVLALVAGFLQGFSEVMGSTGDLLGQFIGPLVQLAIAGVGWLGISGAIEMTPELFVGIVAVVMVLGLVVSR